jgi:hypothetical protein
MSDWADEEAARLSNLDRDTREESQWVCDQIASALRSAFQRGKVEAFREAKKIVRVAESQKYAIQFIDESATALEQENKP